MNETQMEIAMVVETLHDFADKQNDVQDHDEYHAAGAVLSLLNGGMLTKHEEEYVYRWFDNLATRMGK